METRMSIEIEGWPSHTSHELYLFLDNTECWYKQKLWLFERMRTGAIQPMEQVDSTPIRTNREIFWLLSHVYDAAKASGIALGWMTWRDNRAVHEYMLEQYREYVRFMEQPDVAAEPAQWWTAQRHAVSW
jgi:hypothetical protein